LGLAICHRIINERHGGKIYIESEENKGTTIKVELPVGRPLGEN
jgi:two-component system sporulation sensor kinase A